MYFVRIGRYYINLDRVECAEYRDKEPPLILYFSESDSLWLEGEEAESMKQCLFAFARWRDR